MIKNLIFKNSFLLLLLLPIYVYPQQIIENKTFTKGFTLENKKNIVIRNCTFGNKEGRIGFNIQNCENIRIENCKIAGVGNESYSDYYKSTLLPTDSTDFAVMKGNFNAIGLFLMNCKNITVKSCEIIDVFGQGLKVAGDNADKVSGIIIDSCRLAYIYDDGIKVEVENDQSDFDKVLPMKNVVIKNNIIHDIGLGITQLPYARHGMYVKSRDALIEGNTIYNCFYGEGISLRNAGLVRNKYKWQFKNGNN